jgi:hypothetical protein
MRECQLQPRQKDRKKLGVAMNLGVTRLDQRREYSVDEPDTREWRYE